MEGEEIFGSYKQKANLAPKSEGDSHKHDHVNFSHLCVNHIIVRSSVDIEQLVVIKFKKMLRSLKLHVEMEFGIWRDAPLRCMFNVLCCKNPPSILVLQG
jgi:hypothetical protein